MMMKKKKLEEEEEEEEEVPSPSFQIPNFSRKFLGYLANPDLDFVHPHQSYILKRGNVLSDIRHGYSMLVAQWQEGVTRKDMANAFSFEEFKECVCKWRNSSCDEGNTHGAVDYLLKVVRIKEVKNIWQHVIRRKKVETRDKNNVDSGDDYDDLQLANVEGAGFYFKWVFRSKA